MQQEAIKLPEFGEVAHQLEQADAFISPAEAHGLLSGCVCAGSRLSGKSLLEPILGFGTKHAASGKKILMSLYHISSQQLYDADFTFQLLLPMDNASLLDRAKALKEWCQGFISGLGWAGIEPEQCQSEDVQSALLHISEIARLDIHNIIATEEDEKAFLEVVEYVRLAVMSIYMEFSGNQNHQAASVQDRYIH